MPRGAVVSLTHQPGRHPVFHDDFSGKLSAWSVKGEPKASEVVAKRNEVKHPFAAA